MLFQYPKSLHSRKLTPAGFRSYKTYKRYLQHEFERVCVYCRQPDSSAPNLNFSVDHYRPKGLNQFAHLICEYSNLFYCCGGCNSRKNDYWPSDERTGPYVVNPCDQVMTHHLRFDVASGRVQPQSEFGKHTEELLQLNDPVLVEYRKATLTTIKGLSAQLRVHQQSLKELHGFNLVEAEVASAIANIEREIEEIRFAISKHDGSAPLPLLPRIRNGIKLGAFLPNSGS